jgi:diacylglycerol kinase
MNRSLRDAFRAAGCGLQDALRTQRNLRLQCALGAAVLLAGLALRVSASELALLALACGLVVACELANTAVEWLSDAVAPHPSEAARRVKDAAAAAVVVAAAASAAVGALVLGPPVLRLLALPAAWVAPTVVALASLALAGAAAWRAGRVVEHGSRTVLK